MIKKVSFWDLFRLIFVLFALYLMRDAFSRWDGFSYYASFSEFLPSIALASILWSIVSILVAISFWIMFKLIEWVCRLIRMKVKMEHLFIYALMFILSGALAWKGKKLIWPDAQTTFLIKLVVFFATSGISILTAWLLRDKAKLWISIVQDKITPLVWLFGMLIFLSVPLVAYHTWFKNPDKPLSEKKSVNYSENNKRPNIILVTFDALAAKNMSVYGYSRETTPFITDWADKATVFTMAEAASNFTAPAVASLMTGKRVWSHQTYHIEGTKPVGGGVESLPFVLKDNGYFNMALVVNPFASVNTLGMSSSFDIAPLATEFGHSDSLFGWKFGVVDRILYRAFGDKIRLHNWIIKNDFILSKFLNLISRNITETSVPPRKVFNRFLEIIDDDIPEPFFAWIHVFPPHDPYLPPESFEGRFSSSREMKEYKKQEKLIEESYKYLFQYEPVPEEMHSSVELMREYYDEFISYVDKTFDDFIKEFNKRKVENTVIILSADHGESFDHGYFTHGGPFLYEQVTHIPLIIKLPGQEHGQVINDLVEQTDIAPTILNLANIPVPLWMDGRSLQPLMKGEKLPDRPVFSMNFQDNRSKGHQIRKGSIAVWDGDYKLIHYLEKNESLLFNLNKDPEELDNLIDSKPEAGKYLLGLILDNLDNANKRIKNRKQGAEQ